jgi:CheY-like chemotaxis protein
VTVVLIVDDEKALRDGLSEAVRDLGYEAVAAASGREALALAAKAKPDAVLLDLRMQDMDGLQVLTRLREDAGGSKPPVAIITAYATASIARSGVLNLPLLFAVALASTIFGPAVPSRTFMLLLYIFDLMLVLALTYPVLVFLVMDTNLERCRKASSTSWETRLGGCTQRRSPHFVGMGHARKRTSGRSEVSAPRCSRQRIIPNSSSLQFIIANEFKGPSSSQAPYLLSSDSHVYTESLLTSGDSVGGYKMVGIPDGLGAFDNGNGTFTVLMNQELSAGQGAVRAHGRNGAFVSEWVFDKTTLQVLSGKDLMHDVWLYDTTTKSYVDHNAGNSPASFSRFCSANSPQQGAGLRSRASIW